MGNEYRIDVFKPSDAEGVARLFREVYGDGYPMKMVYDPDQLVAAFQNADYIPILARTPDNRIIGYTALYRSAPFHGLYEGGLTLVLPEWRKTPVAGLLFRQTMRIVPTIAGLEGVFCEAVCNHTHTQRAGLLFKYIECAIEVDLMPAEAYEREESATGRVSALDMFRLFVRKHQTVYLPGVYEACFRAIYEGIEDDRVLRTGRDDLPSHRSTQMTTRVFAFARVARVTLDEAGRDFGAAIDKEEQRIVGEGCEIVQIHLKASWPWIDEVVDVLRSRHYFLGGILPRWFGEDGFLMQKTLDAPRWEGINLHTDRAKTILRFIKDDWKSTR